MSEVQFQTSATHIITSWKQDVVDFQAIYPSLPTEYNYFDLLACVTAGECWSVLESKHKEVACLARMFLPMHAAQSFQERVFSSGKIVMKPTRTRLADDSFEQAALLRLSPFFADRNEASLRPVRALMSQPPDCVVIS